MRIAFMLASFPKLSETFILNQITGLLDLGHEVDIFANSKSTDTKVHADVEEYDLLSRTYYRQMPPNKVRRVIKGTGLIIKSLYQNPLAILRALNIIKHKKYALSLRLLYAFVPFIGKEQDYDIIHCHFGPNGQIGAALTDIGLEGKVIVTFHGYDVSSYVRAKGPKVYKSLFEKADLFTVNSNFVKDKAVDLGCDPSKIVKLPVGLCIDRFPFSERRLGAGERINILTVARLTEKKGLEYSIKAVARIIEEYPNVEYKIAGDGPLRNKLECLIDALNIDDRVKLLGWQERDEIIRCYQKSHVFLLASVTAKSGDQEGQGLVLQEAQAMGLPVISTLHNGIPEGVLDGESGFLVPERDVEALTERLKYLIEHPELWPKMGRAGREFVEERYDIKKLNRRLVKIYKTLLEDESE